MLSSTAIEKPYNNDMIISFNYENILLPNSLVKITNVQIETLISLKSFIFSGHTSLAYMYCLAIT